MIIYEYLTIKFNNFRDVKTILKRNKNSNINILFSNQYLSLQGPHAINEFSTLFNSEMVNLIPEAGENIGLALALIELGVKKISISKNLDKDLFKKVQSLAKKKKHSNFDN